MTDLAPTNPAVLAAVKRAIVGEFGICNLNEQTGSFYGKPYKEGKPFSGMRYGYLSLGMHKGRACWWIVDCTADAGDLVVTHVWVSL